MAGLPWRNVPDIDVQVPIVCDNHSAICLAEKEIGYSPRSKHIDLRHHFVREQLERKTISLHYVNSKSQTADVLTKPIPVGRFAEAASNLGVIKFMVKEGML